jgi:hypothetical protein
LFLSHFTLVYLGTDWTGLDLKPAATDDIPSSFPKSSCSLQVPIQKQQALSASIPFMGNVAKQINIVKSPQQESRRDFQLCLDAIYSNSQEVLEKSGILNLFH